MMKFETADKRIVAMGFLTLAADDSESLRVSAENGDSAADYYGEYRGGYPWINPKLETFAEKNGFVWEWENPGVITMYRD